MNIDKIRVNEQVRKDLGSLEELKSSIQEKGILQPLLVDKNNNLIAGHRRLQSAKELGLKDVPIHIIDTNKADHVMEIQLIENIQRKNLDPMEESQAYREYIKTNNATIEQLAKAIGKNADYVRRRVNLKNLTAEVEKALKENKIELGHALLLNQMKKELQKESLNFIEDYDLTVQNFSDQIRWMGIDFMDIEFRPEEKDGTKQQTLLDGIGSETEPLNETEDSLKENDKFKAELGKYVESQRKILREKGVTVFNSEDDIKKKHPGAEEIGSWKTDKYNKAIKGLPNSTTHAVVVDVNSWGVFEKSVFCLELAKVKEEAKTKVAKKNLSEEDKAAADKMLERSREEKLKEKIKIFKHNFLIQRAPNILKLNSKIQRIVTIGQLAAQIGWGIDTNIYGAAAKKILGIKEFQDVKKLLECTPKKLDQAIKELNKAFLSNYYNKELEMIMIEEGFKYETEIVITKEYLELYSKSQLLELAKELGLDKDFIEASKHAKKKEFVEEFLTYELKGMVPKQVVKAK